MDRFDRVAAERELIAMHPEVIAMDSADRRRFVREKLRETGAKITKGTVEIALNEEKLARLRNASYWNQKALEMARDVLSWADADPVISGPGQNFYYRVLASERNGELFINRNDIPAADEGLGAVFRGPWDHRQRLLDAVPFVVTQAYSGLFNPDDIDQGEFRLPYDSCFFQFKVGGRDTGALVWQDAACIRLAVIGTSLGWHATSVTLCFRDGAWLYENPDAATPRGTAPRLGREVQAISILLDAEVAETEVVRAPHQLNKARLRKGRVPLNSYRTIDLSRRRRTDPVGGGGRGGPRLHFRRGHWRHFDGWKTWVRWCVAGDPEKGAVVSDYRV